MKHLDFFVVFLFLSWFSAGRAQTLFQEGAVWSLDPAEEFANYYILSESYDPKVPFVLSLVIYNVADMPSDDGITVECNWIGANDFFIIDLPFETSFEQIRFKLKGGAGSSWAWKTPEHYKTAKTTMELSQELQHKLLLLLFSRRLDVMIWTHGMPEYEVQRLYVRICHYYKEPFSYFIAYLSSVNVTEGIHFRSELSESEIQELKEKHSPEFIESLIRMHSSSCKEQTL